MSDVNRHDLVAGALYDLAVWLASRWGKELSEVTDLMQEFCVKRGIRSEWPEIDNWEYMLGDARESEVRLEGCPFCGSNNVTYSLDRFSYPGFANGRVECQQCHASVESRGNEGDVVELWNRWKKNV